MLQVLPELQVLQVVLAQLDLVLQALQVLPELLEQVVQLDLLVLLALSEQPAPLGPQDQLGLVLPEQLVLQVQPEQLVQLA